MVSLIDANRLGAFKAEKIIFDSTILGAKNYILTMIEKDKTMTVPKMKGVSKDGRDF